MNIKKVILVWIPARLAARLAFAGMTVICIIGFLFLSKQQKLKPSNVKKLKVTVSFYPLAFLAETIGGEYVKVVNLTPPGAEPHEFEPSTKDIAQLENQDIILLNGGGIEGYEDKIKESIDPQKTSVVTVGQSLMSNSQDPHIWLDPVLYKKEAEIITTVFIQKDPSHSLFFTNNMKQMIRDLDTLNTEFIQGLRSCKQKNIITSHKAFGYLAGRYGLREISLAGFSPEQEPSAKAFADVATFVKNNQIHHIFFEELVSPRIAETIARETGAQTLVFNPLEGLTKEDKTKGKTYLSIQKENLKNLQIALNCK